MIKRILVVYLLVAFGAVLAAQSLTLSNVGIKGPSGQNVAPGNTITVKVNYTPLSFDEEWSIIEGTSFDNTGGNLNKVRIQWYTSTDGSGTSFGFTEVATTLFNRVGFTNGTAYNNEVTLTLPTPPVGSNSLRVRTRVYADDGTGSGLKTYSAIVNSGANLAGFYAYLQLSSNAAPTATAVQISNPTFAKVGQTLVGAYTYTDAEGDVQSGTTFRWLIATTAGGTYTAITGATNSTYTLTAADADKYLKFEVTPRAATGTSPGVTVLSPASPQVLEAPEIEVNAYPYTMIESAANDGSLGSAYLTINTINCTFKEGTISGITMTGLPAGLSVGTITRISATVIHIYISGAATEHEYGNSVIDPNDILVHIPANQFVGVESQLTTTNGFYIAFTNNPVRNLALNSVGNNWIKLSWDAPAGLKATGSAINNYRIFRNNIYYDIVFHTPGTTHYTYTDLNAVNGVSYPYKIEANYDGGGTDPMSGTKNATALAITAYAIQTPSAVGSIDHVNKTINVYVPSGTNVNSLIAVFTAPGATVKVGASTQTSGVTPNNFSVPVVYTLSSGDLSTCTYTVTINTGLAAPVPEASNALNQTTSSFTAKWSAVAGATGYLIDVSTLANFSTYLSGYQNLAIGNVTSLVVNNIAAFSTYYYRLKATGANEAMISAYSTVKTVTTLNTGPGTGSTYLKDSDAATINVGNFTTPSQGTVSPVITVNPTNFVPAANDLISVSMSYGASPQGLQYNLSFDNASIGIGTFVLHYNGLAYNPTDIGYRLNGGPITSVGGAGIDPGNKTITITFTSFNTEAKAAYELQIIANDENDITLPVELSSFTLTLVSSDKIKINWITQSETGVQGFYVLRHTEDDLAQAIIVSPMIEATNTSATVTYSYVDDEVPGEGIYYYWLESVDFEGQTAFFGPVSLSISFEQESPIPIIPIITALGAPYPNPFNPTVAIPFDLASENQVSIQIYNVRGQLIRNLLNAPLNVAKHRVVWDGMDSAGKPVTSGTYLVKMSCGKYLGTRKITLMK